MPRARPKISAQHPDDDPRVLVNIRPLRSQLDRIDERADLAGLSRNAWIERALNYALDQPSKITPKEK